MHLSSTSSAFARSRKALDPIPRQPAPLQMRWSFRCCRVSCERIHTERPSEDSPPLLATKERIRKCVDRICH